MSRLNDELVKARAQEIRENLEKVHRYWEIEPERVLTYARENLGDFKAFLAAVGRLMA